MPAAPILVTAAVVERGDRILITQRLPTSSVAANRWEFPGGKLDYLEHPEACLAREILEELGMKVRVGRLIGVSSHVYPRDPSPIHIVLLAYRCEWLEGEPQRLEVQDFRWARLDELKQVDWAEADIPIVEALLAAARGKSGPG